MQGKRQDAPAVGAQRLLGLEGGPVRDARLGTTAQPLLGELSLPSMAAATSNLAWLKSARGVLEGDFCAGFGLRLGGRTTSNSFRTKLPFLARPGPFWAAIRRQDFEADRRDPLELGLGDERVDAGPLLARGEDRAVGSRVSLAPLLALQSP